MDNNSKNKFPSNSLPANFCLLPWHHIFVDPMGECKPCCLIFTNKSWGNLNSSSLEEIWNNREFKEFRKRFLSGDFPKDACKICHLSEKGNIQSQRQRYLQDISIDYDKIKKLTTSEGVYPEIKFKIIDFRPSNICNFKCRTCGPVFSSSWAKEKNLDSSNPKAISPFHLTDDQLLELEEIYFAGGEPLLMQEHYDLLERLIKINKTNIRLRYNSNASVLGIQNRSVLNLWSYFDHVFFGCSIDDIKEQAEYLRKGCSWEKIVENINLIRKRVPHVRIAPNVTVSIFNILRLPEILDEFLRSGILQENNPFDFTFNTVHSPEYFSPYILPLELQINEKNRLIQFFEDWKKTYTDSTFFMYESFLAQLGKIELPYSQVFLKNVREVDELRNERFESIYPELALVFNGKSKK